MIDLAAVRALVAAVRRRLGHGPPPPRPGGAAPVSPAPPAAPAAPEAVDHFARSAIEKAEAKLVELDWRLRAVEAERDTHRRGWS